MFDKAEGSMTSEKRRMIAVSVGAAVRLVGAINSAVGGALSWSKMPRVAVIVQARPRVSLSPELEVRTCPSEPSPAIERV